MARVTFAFPDKDQEDFVFLIEARSKRNFLRSLSNFQHAQQEKICRKLPFRKALASGSCGPTIPKGYARELFDQAFGVIADAGRSNAAKGSPEWKSADTDDGTHQSF